MSDKILIDGDTLTIDEAYAVAADRVRVGMTPKARERMLRTRAVVDDIVERDAAVYGVTTGFGKLSEIAIPRERLAELLVNLGYEVSGSDMQRTDITDRLASLGARIVIGHDARHVGAADVVV